MTGASYVPGSWLGVVRSGTAVLLGPESPAELAGALWELLAARPEPHEVLAAVTSSSGGSLSRIPSFAILDFNGSLRVFLRGELDLAVEQPGGPVDLDGRDVTTWTERRFLVAGKCRLTIAGGTVATGQGAGSPGRPLVDLPLPELPLLELPLVEGVVLLRSLTLGAPSGPAAVAAPAPADRDESTGTSAGGDGTFAVNSSGEVDGPAGIDQPVAPEMPTGGGEPAADASVWTATAMRAATAGDLQQPGAQPDPESAVRHLDPEATIAPGAIIDADGELLEETGTEDSAGLGDPGPELPGPGTTGPEPTAAAGHADAAPAAEMTTSYDHLWDRTVMRNIEDAAVREDPDANSGLVAVNPQPALTAAEQLPALGAAEDSSPAGQQSGAGAESETGATGSEGTDSSPSPTPHTVPEAQAPAPAPTGVLIDSVPWRTGGAASVPSSAPSSPSVGTPPAFAPPAGPDGAANGGSANAGTAPAFPAGRPPAAGTPDQAPAAGFDPDHDGQTVMKSSLPGMAPQPAAPATSQDTAGGPMVLARVCLQGHANPPTRALCSACGGTLLPDAVQVARPRLGRVRLSTGDLLDLDQSMVIGRQPSVSRVQGGVMPRLVQVASLGGDISRSHVEVRLEGWHVMLCDLKATNGTVLVREGQPPRRLAQNEMAILLDGDIAELGDNISLRFEEIP